VIYPIRAIKVLYFDVCDRRYLQPAQTVQVRLAKGFDWQGAIKPIHFPDEPLD
jgi:hypothetical protein